MAPEIMDKTPYMGNVVDLFACGVILFIMFTGHPPFSQAEPNDAHYKMLANNKPELFWKTHEKRKPKGFFSKEFKEVMTCML